MGAIVQGGAWNISTSRSTSADLEVLKSHVNADYMIPIALDASTVLPDTDGVRRLKAGTLLTKNSNGQYQRYQAQGAASDVSTLAISATGGTYNLRANVAENGPNETTDLAWNANIAAIKAALEALPDITTVTVTGTGPYVITVTDPANTSVELDVITGDLTGGSATLTDTTQGNPAQAILGVLATTHEFPDNQAHADAQSQMWNHGQVFRADRIVDWATYGSAARTALPTCRFD